MSHLTIDNFYRYGMGGRDPNIGKAPNHYLPYDVRVLFLGETQGDNVNRFFNALGISADDVADTSNVEDSESDAAINRAVKLYKISDATGSLQSTEVSGMPLTQDMLNPEVSMWNVLT